MLSFPSQNDEKNFPTGRVYSKKRTWVTANQDIFKSGLIKKLILQNVFSRMELTIFVSMTSYLKQTFLMFLFLVEIFCYLKYHSGSFVQPDRS